MTTATKNTKGETMETKKVYRLTLTRWANHAKEWAAYISGADDKYKYKREFCPVIARRWSRSGKNGETDVELSKPGYYQISNPDTGCYGKEAQSFAKLTAEYELVPVEECEVEKNVFGLETVTVN